ncbi:MAG: 5-(carboxyamino)imidazole ribonucleotide mutase [Syntrophales bacterium]|nr:5-(carboxyamino)imidazole ribonucleotide mutase [Syntrophales bacterium]MCK9528489.1 5-(carboxyamino)imidazole ribonucleotide mutase [Syntrophales bacterium]MDX9923026.1 5-(carboxyamino)imidazole ribonucleotide mutase [Syntrophales bacterium]
MSSEQTPLVSVLMGSDSDYSVMKEALNLLEQFDIPCEAVLTSAHRSPERTGRFCAEAVERGVRVIIAGAGAAAHLAGVIASLTTLPVIGVPIDSSPLRGLDALLSTVQMPGGVPVATMAIGKAGATNGALMAVRILALNDASLQVKLRDYAQHMARGLEEKQKTLGS